MTHKTFTLSRWFLTALLISAIGLALTACNTMEGAGKDVEAAGEAVQDAAD